MGFQQVAFVPNELHHYLLAALLQNKYLHTHTHTAQILNRPGDLVPS